MKLLYRFFLWMAEFDVAIGVSTGRNPEVVEADREMVRKFENELTKLELGL
jgi:hypothetical protein